LNDAIEDIAATANISVILDVFFSTNRGKEAAA